MKNFLKENWSYLTGAVLVLFLFSLRLFNLTLLPVFADEAIYIRWAQVMKAEETLRFLPLSDGKEPLFMWVVIPFLKFIRDPLFAGRFVSVLSGLGTLLGIVFLSWFLFKSKKVALAAAGIYAVSPFSFFFDRIGLVDSMLSMFGIWTFIFSYLSITKKRLDFAMLAGFCLGGAWLTKSPALFYVLMLPTLWLFAEWKGNFSIKILVFLKTFALTLITAVIGLGFYNILRLGPNFSMIARRNLDYVYPLVHFITSPLDPLKPFFLQAVTWLLVLGPGILVILWLYGWILNVRKYPKALVVLTIWFLLPIVVQAEFAKVLTARYILFSIPYLIIVAASAFTEVRKNWVRALVVIFAFLISQSVLTDWKFITKPETAKLPRSERSGYLEEWTAGQGIRQTADYLINKQTTYPTQKIVVGTEGYFGTLPDGLQIYLQRYQQITVIGVGLNFSKVPTPLLESKAAGNKTYLLINNERFKGDATKEGLKLIAEYPKAARPDGTHQSLLFFELSGK